jgi:NAD(P)-dependent dehydrogenase (short-subunit alcohol dehydrogenase family)
MGNKQGKSTAVTPPAAPPAASANNPADTGGKKLAIVLGVGPGLGAAIAKVFAEGGDGSFHVALVSRSLAKLEGYAKDIAGTCSCHPADLSKPADIQRVMADIKAAYGATALLVYNAGVMAEVKAMEVTEEQWQRDNNLHVTSALLASQAVFPDMKAAGSGAMLFTGGGLALNPQYGTAWPTLTAGKAALRALVIAMAGELKEHGIRVGTVTVCGMIKPETKFAPELIAQRFHDMYSGKLGDDNVESKFE